MYIPTTKEELIKLGWADEPLDVILVSGDTYVDTYYNGIAIIGKLLIKEGYRVGIIAQPDINSDKDISRLGEPKLFWGVSGGLVDSMVANYTATKKFRKSDDFTPGGVNNRRPDRAVIKYSNLIRQYFKETAPIVLGGIEASLRRVVHYDFWTNKLRRSILFDAKADILLYGMAEKAVIELAAKLKAKEDYRDVRGLCYISNEPKDGYIDLPSFEVCSRDKLRFIDMFHEFYHNNDPITANGLNQLHEKRYLIQNPPQYYMAQHETDEVYGLDFERDTHPYYKKDGEVKGMEMVRFSITTHQGCYGECNFCAITIHQGKTIRTRSEENILNEVDKFVADKRFKGIISDVGGATANMYGYECTKKLNHGSCETQRCLSTSRCKKLPANHTRTIKLLRDIRAKQGVKKVFVASGIRYDLINEDTKYGDEYIEEIVTHHTSGQLKIAPEHSEDEILGLMGKPGTESLITFKNKFEAFNKKSGKNQFLTYYMIAAHPGSSEKHMNDLKKFTSNSLRLNPEQIQIFTPTPSTYSTLMYYTELDPWTKKKIFVEKDINKKQRQKEIITGKPNNTIKRKRELHESIGL